MVDLNKLYRLVVVPKEQGAKKKVAKSQQKSGKKGKVTPKKPSKAHSERKEEGKKKEKRTKKTKASVDTPVVSDDDEPNLQ